MGTHLKTGLRTHGVQSKECHLPSMPLAIQEMPSEATPGNLVTMLLKPIYFFTHGRTYNQTRSQYIMCLCTHVRKDAEQTHVEARCSYLLAFLLTLRISFWDRVSQRTWCLMIQLDCLSNNSPGFLLSLPPTTPDFSVGAGDGSDISHLRSKHWASWASSLQPRINSFKVGKGANCSTTILGAPTWQSTPH